MKKVLIILALLLLGGCLSDEELIEVARKAYPNNVYIRTAPTKDAMGWAYIIIQTYNYDRQLCEKRLLKINSSYARADVSAIITDKEIGSKAAQSRACIMQPIQF